MARQFSKDSGNHYLDLGLNTFGDALDGFPGHSFHVRANIAAFDQSNGTQRFFGMVITSSSSTGAAITLDSSLTTEGTFNVAFKSGTADGLRTAAGTTVISAGEWHSYGGAADFTNKTIDAYLDGELEAAETSVSFDNDTFVKASPTGNDVINGKGVTPSSVHQVDADMCEFAFWRGKLSQRDFHRLSNGESALTVRPDILFLYIPMYGLSSPEPVYASRVVTGDVVGTSAARHPRVFRPGGPNTIRIGPSASTVNSDHALIGSWALGLLADKQSHVDWRNAVDASHASEIENVAEVQGNKSLNSDWIGNIESVVPAHTDWIANRQSDSNLQIESLIESRADIQINLETVSAVIIDGAILAEWLGGLSINSDQTIVVDFAAIVNADSEAPYSLGGTVDVATIVNASWLGSLGVSSILELASALRLDSDSIANVEWTGGLSVDSDHILPLDVSALLAADGVHHVGWKGTLIVDGSVPVETLISGESTSTAIVDWVAGIGDDKVIAIEWEGGIVFLVEKYGERVIGAPKRNMSVDAEGRNFRLNH